MVSDCPEIEYFSLLCLIIVYVRFIGCFIYRIVVVEKRKIVRVREKRFCVICFRKNFFTQGKNKQCAIFVIFSYAAYARRLIGNACQWYSTEGSVNFPKIFHYIDRVDFSQRSRSCRDDETRRCSV